LKIDFQKFLREVWYFWTFFQILMMSFVQRTPFSHTFLCNCDAKNFKNNLSKGKMLSSKLCSLMALTSKTLNNLRNKAVKMYGQNARVVFMTSSIYHAWLTTYITSKYPFKMHISEHASQYCFVYKWKYIITSRFHGIQMSSTTQ